jgi:hypothetical protein
LEDEDHRPSELCATLREDRRGTEGDRDVNIVTASVRDADLLPVILDPDRGREREVGLLGDREGVHVGADRDHRTGATAAEDTHHAGVRDAGAYLEPQGAESVGDDARGACLAIAKLRIPMDVLADRHDLRRESLDRGRDTGILLSAEAERRSGAETGVQEGSETGTTHERLRATSRDCEVDEAERAAW